MRVPVSVQATPLLFQVLGNVPEKDFKGGLFTFVPDTYVGVFGGVSDS